MKFLKTQILPATAIIGDVHQCNSMLVKMIDTCRDAGVKNFIFLGDLLDRGEDAVATVKTLLEIKDISTFLVGNHDWKIIRYHYGRGVGLSLEQADTVAKFKENNLMEPFCNLFYQEWVALLDDVQKVMLCHAPGGRPARFMEKYNLHETGKNDFARLMYGITMGDTENGLPVRQRITESVTDDLDGWQLFHGHIHAHSLHVEPSPNVFCLDFRAGQADGRLAAWVVENNVRNGKLLVINQSLEAVWDPVDDMKPYTPA
jgi:hypothetical protein